MHTTVEGANRAALRYLRTECGTNNEADMEITYIENRMGVLFRGSVIFDTYRIYSTTFFVEAVAVTDEEDELGSEDEDLEEG